MPLTNREAKQLNDAKAEVKTLWNAACIEAGVPTDSKFVVFEVGAKAAVAHNQAMNEFMKLRGRIARNMQRRDRHAAMKSMGLNRVVGAQGGVYYE